MTTREIAIVILASIGVLFCFISAIGIIRLPDVYARMHSFGKASTLGVTCILLSAAVYFPDQFVMIMIIIALFLITAPIATTYMARAAFRTDDNIGVALKYDDLSVYEQAVKTGNKVDETSFVTKPSNSQA